MLRPVSALAAVVWVASSFAAQTVAARATPRPSGASIDRLTQVARQRYAEEANGTAVHVELARIAADAGLRAALATGSETRLQAYVRRQFHRAWYHQHASRVRIVRGSRTLVDVGVPFVVRPSSRALRDANGHLAGTLDVSIQDIIGYVAFMRRNVGVDIVVRGSARQHVRSSIPAAATAPLPDRGAAVIGGQRYVVRSFGQFAYPHEPIKVWVLLRA